MMQMVHHIGSLLTYTSELCSVHKQIYLEIDVKNVVVRIRQKLVQNVVGGQCETGSVDAWVASDQWLIDNFLIHDKLNMVLVIIHQSENTCRARGQIKIGFHIFRRSKG